jgi:hypothetical protein
MFFGALGGLGLAYLGYVKFILGEDIGQRPLILISVMFVVMSIQLLTTGLLGEIISRTYFASADHKPYQVRKSSSTLSTQTQWRSADAEDLNRM